MSSISLYNKLESLPKALKAQVADFVDFLIDKSTKKSKKRAPAFGSAKGKIKISPDFDDPI